VAGAAEEGVDMDRRNTHRPVWTYGYEMNVEWRSRQ